VELTCPAGLPDGRYIVIPKMQILGRYWRALGMKNACKLYAHLDYFTYLRPFDLMAICHILWKFG
jgi:hypothetical protein